MWLLRRKQKVDRTDEDFTRPYLKYIGSWVKFLWNCDGPAEIKRTFHPEDRAASNPEDLAGKIFEVSELQDGYLVLTSPDRQRQFRIRPLQRRPFRLLRRKESSASDYSREVSSWVRFYWGIKDEIAQRAMLHPEDKNWLLDDLEGRWFWIGDIEGEYLVLYRQGDQRQCRLKPMWVGAVELYPCNEPPPFYIGQLVQHTHTGKKKGVRLYRIKNVIWHHKRNEWRYMVKNNKGYPGEQLKPVQE